MMAKQIVTNLTKGEMKKMYRIQEVSKRNFIFWGKDNKSFNSISNREYRFENQNRNNRS